jgi:hypothetical protein
MKTILLSLPTNKAPRIAYFFATPIIGALLTLTSSTLVEAVFSVKHDVSIVIEWHIVFNALLTAPLLETLLCQSAPFAWSTARGKSLFFTVFLMSVPFAVFHAYQGMAAFVETLIGGFILTMIYITWSTAPRPTAFAVTALTHFFHNAGTLTIMLYSGVKLNPIAI